jgi:hypothetical protein
MTDMQTRNELHYTQPEGCTKPASENMYAHHAFALRLHADGDEVKLTFGLRVMCPLVGCSVPDIKPSSVDLPMPANSSSSSSQTPGFDSRVAPPDSAHAHAVLLVPLPLSLKFD